EGSQAHAIVEEAKEHDLIVMGTLGRTGLGRLLLGSVAERVMRHAPCPVMLIRIKEK
ncbi:MAG: universal stress protein, partial [Thermoplasmata archaeon]|nr:universal stress protein [Thermoplasmata archaeon]